MKGVESVMEKSAKSFLKELKSKGVFYTPPFLAEKMKSYIDLPNIEEVYDPTCGQGNLFKVFGDDVKKYGQELDPVEVEKCREALVNFKGYAGDTLTDDHYAGREFQVVFANPPYSVSWEQFPDERWNGPEALAPKSKADWAFGLHCLHHTKQDGICILLMYPGIMYRGNAEQKIRKWLVENNYIERVVNIPGEYIGKEDQFADTKTPTVIIVMRKNKTTTDIIFEEPLYEKEEVVSIEKVREQDYNLSPSTYVERPDTREKVDIIALNEECRQGDLKRVRAMLDVEELIAREFEHDAEPYIRFVEDIEKLVKEHKKKARQLKEDLSAGTVVELSPIGKEMILDAFEQLTLARYLGPEYEK